MRAHSRCAPARWLPRRAHVLYRMRAVSATEWTKHAACTFLAHACCTRVSRAAGSCFHRTAGYAARTCALFVSPASPAFCLTVTAALSGYAPHPFLADRILHSLGAAPPWISPRSAAGATCSYHHGLYWLHRSRCRRGCLTVRAAVAAAHTCIGLYLGAHLFCHFCCLILPVHSTCLLTTLYTCLPPPASFLICAHACTHHTLHLLTADTSGCACHCIPHACLFTDRP